MEKKEHKKVSIQMDATTATMFESLLREGLVASGAVSEADNENLSLRTKKVKVEIDENTAAKISELLRKGLVASGAVSESDNKNLNIMTRDVD